MDYLPVFMRLTDAPSLVVGGGEVAARKVDLLIAAGAAVTVVAPELCPSLTRLRDAAALRHHGRKVQASDLDDVVLVIAATDRPEVNAEVAALARFRRLPVNVVDDPERCSFIMPAIIDRSPVVVAVSTGGASPVLAGLLRQRIEIVLEPALGALARWSAARRARVKQAVTDPSLRRQLWAWALSGSVADAVLAGDTALADARLAQALDTPDRVGEATTGTTVISIASPSPDDLTLGALRAMQSADVVVHDEGQSPQLVALCRRDARRLPVAGPGFETAGLVGEVARAGQRVVRLRQGGGDTALGAARQAEDARLSGLGLPVRHYRCGVTAEWAS